MPMPIRTLGLVASTLLSATIALQAAPLELTSQNIEQQIETEFLSDSAVSIDDIEIATDNGVITLTGRVNNLLAKQRAARLARSVRGVESVINLIDVLPDSSRTDGQIQQEIRNALIIDPATESYEVQVNVSGGVATLAGTVESWQEKTLAGKVAAGVRGVTDIENKLSVRYTRERPDHEIQNEIQQALEWSTAIDFPNLIEVQIDAGEVTLRGEISSAGERDRAEKLAWVNGVDAVDVSALQVADWAKQNDQRSTASERTDPDIVAAIRQALRQNPRVDADDITVESSYGRVTLHGEVDTLTARRSAMRTARNTRGVQSVSSQLQLNRDDTYEGAELADRARSRLNQDAWLGDYNLTVSVFEGTATLEGTVDSTFERSRAEELVSNVRGIQVVDNDLVVDIVEDRYVYDPYVDDYDPSDYDWYSYDYSTAVPTQVPLDSQLVEEIESELWWSPFVGSDTIEVTVEDGKATLTGTVSSYSAKQSASENAIEGGALSVDNQLTIVN